MSSQRHKTASLSVENVGGIDSTEISFRTGITVLAGRNATNRTSLLRSIMGGLGSDNVSLKADADEGEIELEIDGNVYRRQLKRQNGTVVLSGNPYLTDPDDIETANMFAFLIGSNEARRAVANDEDLRDVLMRPLDTVAIEQKINELIARRDRYDEELQELDGLSEQLPELESRRQRLQSELKDLEADLAEKRAALDDFDEGVEDRREDQSELDDRMSDLETARDELTRSRQQLRTETDSVESLEEELQELEDRLSGLTERPVEETDIESELEHLRDRKERIDTDLTELQSIVDFNEKMLDGTSPGGIEALRDEDSSPTDQLLPDDERQVVCWTCGSTVEQELIKQTVQTLRDVRQEKLTERSEVSDRIQELQQTMQEQREHEQERRKLERRIENVEDEISERTQRIEALETDREELQSRVEELESAVRDLQREDQDELLDLNREIKELEFERERVKSELEDVDEKIEDIESRLDGESELQNQREEISERLNDLRTRIERTESEAVEQFNEHMERVLEILGYDNLDRIWIERKQRHGETTFALHVIRSTIEGTAYEDRIEHLSESEREVVGLVFGLAGYLVYEVHETVPFLLLDSLEALDSERISELIDYFGDYSERLVVALLPEDAAAVDENVQRIREI